MKKKLLLAGVLGGIAIIFLYFHHCNQLSDEVDLKVFSGIIEGYEFHEKGKVLVLNADGKLHEYRFIVDDDVLYPVPEIKTSILENKTGISVRIYSEYSIDSWTPELIYPATLIEPY